MGEIRMTLFSSHDRNDQFKQIKQEEIDVVVIGGGITGAGISLDAVTRGLKTAVVEMQDFAAGTSSRSTKLVHGGLRYLQQFQIKMVADVGKEREIVYENGPHVTTPRSEERRVGKECSYLWGTDQSNKKKKTEDTESVD